jgi:hypothetical protein
LRDLRVALVSAGMAAVGSERLEADRVVAARTI